MATATRRKPLQKRKALRKSNPHPGALPPMDPNYPVKPMIDSETGRGYTVISLRLPDGPFIAGILEDQSNSDAVVAQARSRRAAETHAADLYLAKLRARSTPHKNRALTQAGQDAIEDELDWQLAKRRRKQKAGMMEYDRTRYET